MISEPQSATIDFTPEMYQILLLKAQETHKSVSELVNEAIHLYFSGAVNSSDESNSDTFAKEARRQSLLAGTHADALEDVWEANVDDTNWRA